MDLAAILGTVGTIAGTVGTVANAAGKVGNAINSYGNMFGQWGQTSNTTSSGGSTQEGGGHSESGSTSGTNVEQVAEWLKQAYEYQNQEGQNQSQFNNRSMLMQMGYNTLGAIMQGVYNHIENQTAMNFNSTEALASREWSERMSNTSYQRAVADMKAAGLNPILAYMNGGASTPGASTATINGASMGAPSSSALGVSRASGFVPNAYSSESWSTSDWYNAAQSWNQMLSNTQMTPYGLSKTLTEIGNKTGEVVSDAVKTGKDAAKGAAKTGGNLLEKGGKLAQSLVKSPSVTLK